MADDDSDIGWLAEITVACDLCIEFARQVNTEYLKATGNPIRAAALEAYIPHIEATEDTSRCEFGVKGGKCISRETEETMIRRIAAAKPDKEMTVVCNECHKYFQRIARFVRERKPDQETLDRIRFMEQLRRTNDLDKCENPTCDSKPRLPHQHSCEAGDPDKCNCECSTKKRNHTEILGYIKKIELLHRKLTISYGVVQHLREASENPKASRLVDKSVPCGGLRVQLEAESKLLNELKLGDETIETKAGRRLCHVPQGKYHCHVAKMNAFAPANCTCTPVACTCSPCILEHVKHCVEDYEDAVSRVSVGITKLRAAPRQPPPNQSAFSESEPTSGGSAMPGVRKSKHLSGYVAAQKDAHNSSRR